MTNLATALGQGSEKTLVRIEPYRGDGTQDPITWLEDFERAAKINRWNAVRQLELAYAYVEGNALEWLTSLANAPTSYNTVGAINFKGLFKD